MPGVGDGQEGLACCSPWGLKESAQLSDWTALNWTEVLCFKHCIASCLRMKTQDSPWLDPRGTHQPHLVPLPCPPTSVLRWQLGLLSVPHPLSCHWGLGYAIAQPGDRVFPASCYSSVLILQTSAWASLPQRRLPWPGLHQVSPMYSSSTFYLSTKLYLFETVQYIIFSYSFCFWILVARKFLVEETTST